MIDPATIEQLATLRRQISATQATAGRTLDAMSLARHQTRAAAEATPFLTSCAKDLEALAAVCRLAAAEAQEAGLAD